MRKLLKKISDTSALYGIAVVLVLLVGVTAGLAIGSSGQQMSPQKRTMPRDNVYYEIGNDADDHGNFWETYHVPVTYVNRIGGDPQQAEIFCMIYTDQIQKYGGGAAGNCDFEGFYRLHPNAKSVSSRP